MFKSDINVRRALGVIEKTVTVETSIADTVDITARFKSFGINNKAFSLSPDAAREVAASLIAAANVLQPQPVVQRPARPITMTKQMITVLNHLRARGSLSNVEAGAVYKIRALPRRIADLKALGFDIKSEMRRDQTGQRYARYTLVEAPAVSANAA